MLQQKRHYLVIPQILRSRSIAVLVRQHFTDTFYGFNADYHAKTTQPYDDAYFFVYDYLAENDEPTWIGKCDVMPPLRQRVTMSVRDVTVHRTPQYAHMVGLGYFVSCVHSLDCRVHHHHQVSRMATSCRLCSAGRSCGRTPRRSSTRSSPSTRRTTHSATETTASS